MEKFDNSTIRRQDRTLDEAISKELIVNGEFAVISMVENIDGETGGYGIPVNYVWDNDGYIYIHCAPEGHKLESLDANGNISLCIVGKTNVISHKFTTAYQSVVIRGKVVRSLPAEERMKAIELILDK